MSFNSWFLRWNKGRKNVLPSSHDGMGWFLITDISE
jgi:hypothetical protein